MNTKSKKQKTILLVDDDDSLRVFVSHLLTREGYLVMNAVNGADALEFLKKSPDLPSLILLDLRMPVMDGWQFRTIQKADPRFCNIPVIVITSVKTVENDIQSIQAAGYCKKPLQTDILLQLIEDNVAK
jgi:CheY-like chemotaxis protein